MHGVVWPFAVGVIDAIFGSLSIIQEGIWDVDGAGDMEVSKMKTMPPPATAASTPLGAYMSRARAGGLGSHLQGPFLCSVSPTPSLGGNHCSITFAPVAWCSRSTQPSPSWPDVCLSLLVMPNLIVVGRLSPNHLQGHLRDLNVLMGSSPKPQRRFKSKNRLKPKIELHFLK